jgi:hypothetical protein
VTHLRPRPVLAFIAATLFVLLGSVTVHFKAEADRETQQDKAAKAARDAYVRQMRTEAGNGVPIGVR